MNEEAEAALGRVLSVTTATHLVVGLLISTLARRDPALLTEVEGAFDNLMTHLRAGSDTPPVDIDEVERAARVLLRAPAI